MVVGDLLVLEEMEGGEGCAELGGEGVEGGVGVFVAEGEDLLGEGLVEDGGGYGVGSASMELAFVVFYYLNGGIGNQ